jgi:hypothetical protein
MEPYFADGPLEALLRALRVVRGDRRDFVRESLLFALVGWLPFMLLAAVDRAWGAPSEPLVRDLGVHTRLLVAVPLFLGAQRLLGASSAVVIERLAADGFVEDRALLARVARSSAAWARSPLAELTLLAGALVCGQAMGSGLLGASGPFVGAPLTTTRGAATLWYAWAAFPLFFFLGLRFIARWLGWAATLLRVARLPLETEPTHPDRAGGLEFLARPTLAAALFVLGATSVAAATWASAIIAGNARPTQLANTLVIWIVLAFLLALSPLFGFAGCLARTRRRGKRELDLLSLTLGRMFRRRWIDRVPGPELLGAADISSLHDLQGAYEPVQRMHLVPLPRRTLIVLVVAALLPFGPAALVEVPLTKLLWKAAQTVLGVGH